MSQGMAIVLPQIIFFILDIIIYVKARRTETGSKSREIFTFFSLSVIIQQLFSIIAYASVTRLVILDATIMYTVISLTMVAMSATAYYWFLYLVLTVTNKINKPTMHNIIFVLPLMVTVMSLVLNLFNHRVFYINGALEYKAGPLSVIQVMIPVVYALMALLVILRMIMKRMGKEAVNTLHNMFVFLIPAVIGTLLSQFVYKGGYTEIGISISMLLMYLNLYMEEANELKRLRSVDKLNARLTEINGELDNQLQITMALNNQIEESACETEAQLEEITNLNEKLKENFDIIGNAGYGIWRIYISPDGNKTMVANDKLEEIFGIKGMNMSPEELYIYYHSRLADDVAEIESDDYNSMYDGNLRTRLLTWYHPSKGTIYLRAGGRSYTLENGQTIISGYCGDVTEQKFHEDMMNAHLEEVSRQAEAANKAKTAFLFNMSHDIRTPMNAIVGFSDLLENNLDDKEKARDYLNKIRSSSNFLLSLVNNVLDVARIESGKATLDEGLHRASDLMDEVTVVFSERMKQKNITFTHKEDCHTYFIYADMVKLKQILLNLVSNAYKYTPDGGSVSVTVTELTSAKEGYALFETKVSDTGIGMSKEFLPHIFEEFSREKTYTEDGIEGTGLGMPIVKKLVDLMGGTISVESELGKGTTFTYIIPHRIGQEPENPEADIIGDKEKMAGIRILYAEDNDLNAEIGMELLNGLGAIVDRAEDGAICVDMYSKAEAGYYDIILMDVQMPNMDGYKATQLIRRLDDPKKNGIPIIAMTANAFDEDKKNALAAGMDAHVAKPVDFNNFVRIALELINDYWGTGNGWQNS